YSECWFLYKSMSLIFCYLYDLMSKSRSDHSTVFSDSDSSLHLIWSEPYYSNGYFSVSYIPLLLIPSAADCRYSLSSPAFCYCVHREKTIAPQNNPELSALYSCSGQAFPENLLPDGYFPASLPLSVSLLSPYR